MLCTAHALYDFHLLKHQQLVWFYWDRTDQIPMTWRQHKAEIWILPRIQDAEDTVFLQLQLSDECSNAATVPHVQDFQCIPI